MSVTIRDPKNCGLAGSPFHTTVESLAQRTGQTGITVVCDDRYRGGFANAEGVARTISVHPEMLDLDAPVQQWVAAHEFAHIHRDHHQPWAVMVPVYVSLAIVGLAVIAAAQSWVRWMPGVAVTATLVLVVDSLLFTVAYQQMCTVQRENERDADLHALLWGYPFTPAVEDAIAAAEAERAGWIPMPVAFRQHDRPHTRRAYSEHITKTLTHGLDRR